MSRAPSSQPPAPSSRVNIVAAAIIILNIAIIIVGDARGHANGEPGSDYADNSDAREDGNGNRAIVTVAIARMAATTALMTI